MNWLNDITTQLTTVQRVQRTGKVEDLDGVIRFLEKIKEIEENFLKEEQEAA